MIDTKALRSKILDLAISGKLTEQLPEDGNAEDLYVQIQGEKSKLIEEGKIKKEKPLPPITEEEIPFEIPENWKWVRVSDIIKSDVGGGTPRKDTVEYWENGNIPWMTVKDFSSAKDGYINDTIDHITELGLENSATNMVDENALIVCMRMALGKIVRPTNKMAINQDLRAIWLLSGIYNDYFYYYYMTLNVKGHGMTVSGINRSELMMSLISLPPLAEQNRIVSAVEDAFAVIDRIEKAQESYYADQEVLKNKIIDAGIRGKLTEQLPEDGDAEDLYAQIQEEKAKLISEGKIKKEKSLPPITEDETPFEIPKNWKWIRFAETGSFKKGPFGSALTKAIFVPKGNNTIKVYEQQHAIRKKSDLGTYYITREYFDEKMKSFEVLPGNIIVSCAGTIGETYIMPNNIEKGIINQALMKISLSNSIEKRFFLYYFDSNLKSSAKDESNGSAIKNIPPFDVMKRWCFPLPPYEEQKRIVETIDSIVGLL